MMKKILSICICLLLAACICACGSKTESDTESADVPKENTEKTNSTYSQDGIALRITGSKPEKTFTVEDLKKLGVEKVTYSGRNKANNNKRQVRDYQGVALKKVLKAAGYDDPKNIQVICADGYSRKYALSDLYGLYAYKDDQAEKGTNVEPMLAIIKEGEAMGNDKTYEEKSGSPLRLVYGQADYDCDETKDFNMQGWAYYLEKIKVLK